MRGSASCIVREVQRWERERERDTERERERERERRKWRHHCRPKIDDEFTLPLPKIRTISDEFTLSLAKHSHFSFLPSHFPSLPSRIGHHCGAEIRNELTLSVAKKFCPLCSDSLKCGASRVPSDRNPRQKIKSCPVLYCSSHRKNESD